MEKFEPCKKCDSKNIEYNFWGMPAEEAIKDLESIGYTVNLKGCVPPLVGEEVFLYVCQDCGFGYGDIDGD